MIRPLGSAGRLVNSVAVGLALLYFLIGKVNYEPRLALGSISLNQLLQISVLLSLVVLPWRGEFDLITRSRTMWMIGVLAILLWVQSLESKNTAYAPDKPLGYLGLVIPTFVLIAAYGRGTLWTRRFLVLWASVGTVMMLSGIAMLASGDSPPRLAVLGGGANGYARMLGTALLIWLGLQTSFPRLRWKIWWMTLPGFGIALLFAGSKTAVLGIGVSLAILGAYWQNRRLLVGAFVGLAVFATAPLWTHGLAQPGSKNRGEVRMFTQPDTQDPRGSYGTRLFFYHRSFDALRSTNLLGVGTGEWHSVVGLPSGRQHPHNLELELGCEQGLIGLTWLALMLALAARWAWRRPPLHSERVVHGTLIAILTFWIFNAQLNGDLLDNRWIWLAVLLLELGAIGGREESGALGSASERGCPQRAGAIA